METKKINPTKIKTEEIFGLEQKKSNKDKGNNLCPFAHKIIKETLCI